MHRLLVVAFATLAINFGITGCGHASGDPLLVEANSQQTEAPKAAEHSPTAAKTMRAFRSEAELTIYLKQLERRLQQTRQEGMLAKLGSFNQAAPAAAPAKDMAAGAAEQGVPSPTRSTRASTKAASSNCTAIIWSSCGAAGCSPWRSATTR